MTEPSFCVSEFVPNELSKRSKVDHINMDREEESLSNARDDSAMTDDLKAKLVDLLKTSRYKDCVAMIERIDSGAELESIFSSELCELLLQNIPDTFDVLSTLYCKISSFDNVSLSKLPRLLDPSRVLMTVVQWLSTTDNAMGLEEHSASDEESGQKLSFLRSLLRHIRHLYPERIAEVLSTFLFRFLF